MSKLVHFYSFREEITIEQLIKPIATFLASIFFVLMSIQVLSISFLLFIFIHYMN